MRGGVVVLHLGVETALLSLETLPLALARSRGIGIGIGSFGSHVSRNEAGKQRSGLGAHSLQGRR